MNKKKVIVIIGIVLVIVVAVVILLNRGSKSEEKGLVGKWAYSSFVYTFNEDKTGMYDSLGNVMNFTYEADGSKVSILYEGNTAPLELNYRIEENKLIITDSFGADVEYIRK